MTTEFRAVPSRSRVGQRPTNFHEPIALDAYASHFQRIGIASVAAAAAQVKTTRPDERADAAERVALLQRWDHDAA